MGVRSVTVSRDPVSGVDHDQSENAPCGYHDEGSCRQHFSLWMEPGVCSPWARVAHLGQRVRLRKNETIFGEGDCVDGVYYVVSGVLRLVSFNSAGKEAILLYVTEQNLIGDSAFFNRMPVYATFSAVEDVELSFFPGELVQNRILVRYPDLQRNMLEYMAYKVGVLLHHQCEVVSDDVFGKVSRLIYDIAKHSGFDAVISLKITQEEMATALGLHRATFNKTISELKRQGVLDWTKKQEIVIKDYETIRRYADNAFAL